jgi:hypothetical protein
MDRGKIPINKNYEFEYRYYDKDPNYKYFNRKFEVFLLGKKLVKPEYILHMDNSDIRHMAPGVFKASHGKKRHDFGITTLNWNDIKNTFLDFVIEEIGVKNKESSRKALTKLSSPKL